MGYLHDFVHHDVLIRLSVVLAGGEAERCSDQVIAVESGSGLLAEDGGYVTVFELAAQLLQNDITHTHLAAFGLLTLHKEGIAL